VIHDFSAMMEKHRYYDVPGVTYPLHLLDDTKFNRDCISWSMRFNDVLDAEMLRDSLSDLLDMGNWRKLGGRLRPKVYTLSLHSNSPTYPPLSLSLSLLVILVILTDGIHRLIESSQTANWKSTPHMNSHITIQPWLSAMIPST
jgi:hypothetical protein